MNAFGNGQVKVSHPTGMEFLFVAQVVSINARVGIVFAKNRNPRELRERARRQGRGGNDLGISREEEVSGNEAAVNFLLLYAIGRDRANLSQHVLTGVEDTGAATEQ